MGNTYSDTCNTTGIPGQVTDKPRESQEWRSEAKRQENVAALAHGIVPAHRRVNLTEREPGQDDQELETSDIRKS